MAAEHGLEDEERLPYVHLLDWIFESSSLCALPYRLIVQRFCAERFHKDNVETYDPQLKNFRLDWKNPVELPPMEIETNKGNLLSHETVIHARNFWSGLEDKTLDGAAAAIRNLQDSSFKDLVRDELDDAVQDPARLARACGAAGESGALTFDAFLQILCPSAAAAHVLSGLKIKA